MAETILIVTGMLRTCRLQSLWMFGCQPRVFSRRQRAAVGDQPERPAAVPPDPRLFVSPRPDRGGLPRISGTPETIDRRPTSAAHHDMYAMASVPGWALSRPIPPFQPA